METTQNAPLCIECDEPLELWYYVTQEDAGHYDAWQDNRAQWDYSGLAWAHGRDDVLNWLTGFRPVVHTVKYAD